MKILAIDGKEKGNIELPEQFKEPVRNDIVKRAVEVIQANRRQPYGSKKFAGMMYSAEVSKQRHDYKTSYGHGIGRVPRKIMSRNGTQMFWVGAFVSGTVGGRRAHPPKALKIWDKSLNDKERKKAIRSCLAATVDKDIVRKRGHIIPGGYPFVVENKIEEMQKTKDVQKVLETLGLKDELQRVKEPMIRAGRGKSRGRRYRVKKGPLLVVGKDCKLIKAASNIPGIEVSLIKNVSCDLLAPGASLGRLTLFTEDAIKELKEKKLFA
jgi:large subunit ribosomal protein L4e